MAISRGESTKHRCSLSASRCGRSNVGQGKCWAVGMYVMRFLTLAALTAAVCLNRVAVEEDSAMNHLSYPQAAIGWASQGNNGGQGKLK